MNLKRIARHLFYLDRQVHKAFGAPVLQAIESAIKASEQTHGGQIRFAVEGNLDAPALFKGQTPSERAIEVFSQLGVWDTEHNNGVLIYVLMADHAVEIVADRGIHTQEGQATWQAICQTMQTQFAARQFEAGAVAGIQAVAQVMRKHFPVSGAADQRVNDLPDAPVVLN